MGLSPFLIQVKPSYLLIDCECNVVKAAPKILAKQFYQKVVNLENDFQ